MKKYYFLICSFPTLTFGEKPDFTFDQLLSLIDLNVEGEDLKKIEKMRQFFDLKNIQKFWQQKTLDKRGNLQEKLLEEALLTETLLPDYVFDYLSSYDNKTEQQKNFAALYGKFFQSMQDDQGFLGWYFDLERKIRLSMVYLRAAYLEKDLATELRFEDSSDWDTRAILALNEGGMGGIFVEFEELKNLYRKYQLQPLQLYKEILLYRFNKVEEQEPFYGFTIDEVLAYIIKLMLVEDWNALDEKKALSKLESFA